MNKKIIKKNLGKHFSASLFYFAKPIDDIIYNYSNSLTILFNDNVFYDEIEENLRRYYNTYETRVRLTNYTEQYNKIKLPYFCNLSKTKVKSILFKREHKYYKYQNEVLNLKPSFKKILNFKKNNFLLKNLDKITEIIEEVDDENTEIIKKRKFKMYKEDKFELNKSNLDLNIHNIYKLCKESELKSNSISYSLNYFICDQSNIKQKFNIKTENKLEILDSINITKNSNGNKIFKKNKKKKKLKKDNLRKNNLKTMKTKMNNRILKKSSKVNLNVNIKRVKTQSSNKISKKKIQFKWLKTYNKKDKINLNKYSLKNKKGLTGSLTALVRPPINKNTNVKTKIKYFRKKQIKKICFDNHIFSSNKNLISNSPILKNKKDIFKKNFKVLFSSEAVNKIKKNKILISKSIFKSLKFQKNN